MFRKMLRYVKPYWRLYWFGSVTLLIVDFLDAFAPKIIQWALDDLQHKKIPIWPYAIAYIAIVAFTGFFRYHLSFAFSRAGLNVVQDLRSKLFNHLQHLPTSYHDQSKIGAHLTLASSDIDSCRMFYSFGLLLLLDTLFYFILIPSFMLTISVKLLFVSMLCLPFLPLIISRLTHAVESRYEHMQKEFEVLSERARESYSGAKVVQSFVQERSEVKAFARISQKYLSKSLYYAKVLTLELPLWVLLFGLADLVVVIYGGHLVLKGEVSGGAFAAFFQYLVRLSGPMMVLGWVVAIYQRAKVSLVRIEEVLQQPQARNEPKILLQTLPKKVDISCKHLSFSYKQENVLNEISFTLEKGKTLALVGPVGSGKSTLLHLITRLYEPPKQTLYLDGNDICDLSLTQLRQILAMVPQETFLFSGTILENIRMGAQTSITDEELIEFAELSQLAQDVKKMSAGYATLLGEKGVNLSGGQKQRLAIARALAHKPALLLLDDCLSAVDTHTEKAILKNLMRVRQHCTTIVVSHRLSTVQDADEIIVLDKGAIIQRGTHQQLVKQSGYYQELYQKQQLQEQLAS